MSVAIKPHSAALALPTRGHDWRDLLHLAWPMLVGQVAQVGMGVADTVMAGAVSPTDLAAVAMGFSLWLPTYVFCIGVLSALTATIARAFGASDQSAQAAALQQGVWLAAILAVFCIGLVTHGHRLLPLMHVDPAVQPLVRIYLQGIAFGVFPIMMFQVLRALSEGSGRSKPVMVIQVIAFLVNIPLNYIFIHGLPIYQGMGVPQLGGAGCGWATGSVMWLQLLMLGWLLRKRWRPLLSKEGGGFHLPQWRRLGALTYLGVPIGAAMFAETSIFAGAALLIGRLGATPLAAHQIALNFSALMFMVPMSLGQALTVKIGHALGADQIERARRFAGLGAATSMLFAVCSATLMLSVPYTIASAYTHDEAVRLLTVQILFYSACFQLFDGLQVTAVGSLRGYHDTRVTMIITLIAYWGVGLPLGYLLGFSDWLMPRNGVFGVWTGLIGGLIVAAALLNWRLALISRRFQAAQ
ncbi:MAG: MATE family efflux transporter [Spongiibacteraceae bacterium]